MHEMALVEGILDVVLDVAGGQPVKRIQLRVGALQRIVPDSLQFCFQLAAQDTPAAAALLELEESPARLRCRRCDLESEFKAPPFQCLHCGAFDLDIAAGDEVLVEGVELEDGWRRRPGGSSGTRATIDVSEEHLREHALAEGHAHGAEALGPARPAN